MFAAVDGDGDDDSGRVECVRLLVRAGADVSARDREGNTPLHETFLTDVEEELMKLGADVNARDNDGETPIFTTVDDDAIPLFIKYGADLTIRNNQGQTVIEAAKERGPNRQKALRQAIQQLKPALAAAGSDNHGSLSLRPHQSRPIGPLFSVRDQFTAVALR